MASGIDIVLQALSPQIVIFSDDSVDQSCKLNGCKSLDELFKPWQSRVERVPILSSLLSSTTHPTYAVRFTSHAALLESHFGGGGTVPYSPEIVVDIVSNLLGATTPDQNLQYDILRAVLLASSPLSGQDTFNYPVCYMFATSSSNPDPLGTLAELSLAARQSPVLSENPHVDAIVKAVQHFYLVVHDVATEGTDIARSHRILEQIVERYGPHCSLLVINSRKHHSTLSTCDETDTNFAADSPGPFRDNYETTLNSLTHVNPFTRLTEVLAEDVRVVKTNGDLIAQKAGTQPLRNSYAQYLDESDVQSIRECIRGLIVQSVIPWMEARVREWNEVYSGSRKGVAAKLFGAGRKLFGSAGLGPTIPSKVHVNGDISQPERTFLSTSKRLGDFAFMLRDYKLAASVYQGIQISYPADMLGDRRAGLTLIQAISHLLSRQSLGTQRQRDVADIPRESRLPRKCIETLGEIARSPQGLFANRLDLLRDFLLLFEAWQLEGAHAERIAMQGLLVEVAGKTEDILRAVLLEKAARTDMATTHIRERGLHFFLASREYAQCGHKLFCQHSLLQALTCFRPRPAAWRYIQAYIHYALAQQAYITGETESALKYFTSLLVPGSGSPYQAGILKDASLAWQRLSMVRGIDEGFLRNLLPQPIFQDSCMVTYMAPTTHSGRQGEDHDHMFSKAYVTAYNATTVSLRLTNIELSLGVDDERSIKKLRIAKCSSEVLILPNDRKQIALMLDDKLLRHAASCSLTYRVEQFIDCEQHLTLLYEQARQRKHSHSTVQGDENPHLDVSAKLVDSPLEFEFTDITWAPPFQRGIVSFTLNLLNNSPFDIIDIHICSLTPEYNVTWLNAEATQMDAFFHSRPQDEIRCRSSAILAKLLQPSEARIFHGNFVSRSDDVPHLVQIGYAFKDGFLEDRVKHIKATICQQSLGSSSLRVTERGPTLHLSTNMRSEASLADEPSSVCRRLMADEASRSFQTACRRRQIYRNLDFHRSAHLSEDANNYHIILQSQGILLENVSMSPSLGLSPQELASILGETKAIESCMRIRLGNVAARQSSARSTQETPAEGEESALLKMPFGAPGAGGEYPTGHIGILDVIGSSDNKRRPGSASGRERQDVEACESNAPVNATIKPFIIGLIEEEQTSTSSCNSVASQKKIHRTSRAVGYPHPPGSNPW